jgi:hypothetical protein
LFPLKYFGFIRYLVFVIFFLCLCCDFVESQITGDYRSRISGNWGAYSTWEKWDGVSWNACAFGDVPNESAKNVTIRNGHLIDTDGSGSPPWDVNDLNVESGGRLWDNQFGGINTYIQVYGDIICDGIIGDPQGDDISFDIAGGNDCTISGIGFFNAMRIRKDDAILPKQTTSLTIKMDINLLRTGTSATVLYNDANEPGTDLNGSLFIVTIDAGSTVRCTAQGDAMCHISMDGIYGADPENCGGSYIVFGTLEMDGAFYCKNNNSAKNTSVLIKNGGLVKCRYIETGASGSAGNTLRVENGGKLIISGSVDTSSLRLNSTTFNGFSNLNNSWEFEPMSSLEFSASTDQMIHGISHCGNLAISGGGLKVLDADFLVGATLSLTSGVIQTGLFKLIHTSANPYDLVHSSGNASFIFGTYRRYILSNTAVYEFPLGLSARSLDYHRIDLLNANLNGISFIDGTVKSLSESENNIDSRIVCLQDTAIARNVLGNSVWSLSPDVVPISGSYGVRLYLEGTGLDETNNNSFHPVKRPDGSMDYSDWDTFDASTDIPQNGLPGRVYEGGSGYSERNGYTSFSEHAIALFQSNMPLSIELISFSAYCYSNKIVDLQWETATEQHSDYFLIEHSENGWGWESVSKIKALGNSNRLTCYRVKVESQEAIGYYRLSQYDIDGKSMEFDPVIVNCKNELKVPITVPNPSEHTFTVQLNDVLKITPFRMVITDIDNRIIMNASYDFTLNQTQIPIELPPFSQGVYFIHFKTITDQYFIVRHHVL